MIRTVEYSNVVIVESNVIRPEDIYLSSVMDTEGEWYDIYAIAGDGVLVAVHDTTLEDEE